ncbi:MAG: DNA polymerase III subunit gamma/tau [Lachnospiraceae bacterium]|nr:DNA polymerase III subunit gamma/tau [Lachnospiraceae bacterium]
MSYTALYRKWRPTTFEDVKGQDPIVTTLKNQIETGRIGHAYLFCGTRGTGKTTVAKIFARAVNCEHPENGSPCGKCASCQAIAREASMNVSEIDAASNNGVDNIRDLREEIKYSPTEGKYRVYIIDEVHMLSGSAFNALLKTLEEPPSYVIFILATTEPNKIPITVLSRCQRYDFRRAPLETIYDRLREMTDAEGVPAEEKALKFIARKGDGSFRDAISLLDQCIAFHAGKELTFDRVLDSLGAVNTEMFSHLFRNAVAGEALACLKVVEEITERGRDLSQFASDFVWYLRNMMLVKAADGEEDSLEMSAEDLKTLKEEEPLAEMDTLMRYIRLFSDLLNQMRYAVNKRVLLEMAIIRLCRPEMEKDLESVLQRLDRVEAKIEKGVVFRQEAGGALAKDAEEEAGPKEERVVELEPAVYADYQAIMSNWRKMLRDLGGTMQPALASCRVEPMENSTMRLCFTEKGKYFIVNRPEKLQEMEKYVAEHFGKSIHFETAFMHGGEQEKTTYVSREEAAEKILMPIETEE